MTTESLPKALLAFQAEGVKLQKDSINPHFKNKYISLDSLMGHVLPVMNQCGLVLLQLPTEVEGTPSLTTRIVHAATGESVEATMPLALSKTDPQSQGSAITYARRYALMSFLGLVADEDTDGRAPTRAGRSAKGNAEPRRAAAEEAPTRAVPPADGTTPPRDPKYASVKQTGRLWGLAKEHGVDEQTLRAIILKHTGQESGAEIPKGKYDAICVDVQTFELAVSLADGTAEVPFT